MTRLGRSRQAQKLSPHHEDVVLPGSRKRSHLTITGTTYRTSLFPLVRSSSRCSGHCDVRHHG